MYRTRLVTFAFKYLHCQSINQSINHIYQQRHTIGLKTVSFTTLYMFRPRGVILKESRTQSSTNTNTSSLDTPNFPLSTAIPTWFFSQQSNCTTYICTLNLRHFTHKTSLTTCIYTLISISISRV